MDLFEKELTYKIRSAVFEVSRELGAGFLERVYEKALVYELSKMGLVCETQKKIEVIYKGMSIGDYVTDVLVENRIVLELKAQRKILPEHTAQLLNYLKASSIKLGLLINFTHPKAEIKRYIL